MNIFYIFHFLFESSLVKTVRGEMINLKRNVLTDIDFDDDTLNVKIAGKNSTKHWI